MNDRVGRIRWHREANRLNKLVVPKTVARRDTVGELLLWLLLAEKHRLYRGERRSAEALPRSEQARTRSETLVLEIDLRGRSAGVLLLAAMLLTISWNPNEIMSGLSTEVRH